jgi:hypothetical protein
MMTRLILACALSASMTSSAVATDLCAAMHKLTKLSQAGFVGTFPHLGRADFCTIPHGTPKVYRCMWEFDFRAEESRATFTQLDAQLQTCFGKGGQPDTGVNHPDSYTQHRYDFENIVVRVSLKDKGASALTYVFLAVESQ